MSHRSKRWSLLVVGAMITAVASLTSTASASTYTDMTARVGVETPQGVKFYVVPRLNASANLVYAEGKIDATGSSYAGRLYYVSLWSRNAAIPEAPWRNVRNTPSDQDKATNDSVYWSTGTWTCSPGFVYKARLQYHVDGTSTTGYLEATSPVTNC